MSRSGGAIDEPVNVRQLLERIVTEADVASRHYVLIDARIEALLTVPVPRPDWVRAAIRHLRDAASSCALQVARLLNTTPDRARHILEDYVAALEDAEQEHDPAGFAQWLVDEAALTGYLHWVNNVDEDDDWKTTMVPRRPSNNARSGVHDGPAHPRRGGSGPFAF